MYKRSVRIVNIKKKHVNIKIVTPKKKVSKEKIWATERRKDRRYYNRVKWQKWKLIYIQEHCKREYKLYESGERK